MPGGAWTAKLCHLQNLVIRDYNLVPTKPCFDGEPRYEDHPVGWNHEVLGWFDEADVRQALYWNLFSGAFGHTYGCHPIWQMKTRKERLSACQATCYDVLDLPGGGDLIHARRLLESRPFLSRIPDQSLLTPSYVPETDYVVATRGDGYAFVYFPTGYSAEIEIGRIGTAVHAWWYDPRTGEPILIETLTDQRKSTFTPPDKGRGNDWILVLDDASRGFDFPGK